MMNLIENLGALSLIYSFGYEFTRSICMCRLERLLHTMCSVYVLYYDKKKPHGILPQRAVFNLHTHVYKREY